MGVVKNVRFKAYDTKFEKDFTICKFEVMDIVLGNIFIHFYIIEVKQGQSYIWWQ